MDGLAPLKEGRVRWGAAVAVTQSVTGAQLVPVWPSKHSTRPTALAQPLSGAAVGLLTWRLSHSNSFAAGPSGGFLADL